MGDSKREVWVDNVKVIACILVVLGHFIPSLMAANILADRNVYEWFKQTIYYFHVPLFFICSGYLYQKYSKVNDGISWKENVLKKMINLGIPYFSFSFVTWILMTVFSGSTNRQADRLFETLFVKPNSPYWYLYALFFIFLITLTFTNRRVAVCGMIVALCMKSIILITGGFQIRVITYILSNEIWFVIGMCLCIFNFRYLIDRKKWYGAGIIFAIIFFIISIVVYHYNINVGIVNFLLGIIACASVIMIVTYLFRENENNKMFHFLSKYTMPIFVMHTLFAAPVRVILLKVGISNAAIHVLIGIAISFIGPIVATIIMKKVKWLEIFLYPGKFIKI